MTRAIRTNVRYSSCTRYTRTRAANSGCARVVPRLALVALDCKQPIVDAVRSELAPIRDRAREFEEDPQLVRNILREGGEAARDVATETMDEVRAAIGLNY